MEADQLEIAIAAITFTQLDFNQRIIRIVEWQAVKENNKLLGYYFGVKTVTSMISFLADIEFASMS